MFVLSQALFLSFFFLSFFFLFSFFFFLGGGGRRKRERERDRRGEERRDLAPCINLSVSSPEIFADLTASNLL